MITKSFKWLGLVQVLLFHFLLELELAHASNKPQQQVEEKQDETINDNECGPAFGGKIKHVIALMFENRSFDHLLGYLRSNRSDIDGCIPSLGMQCQNPLLSNMSSTGPWYSVNKNVTYTQASPDHSLSGITLQFYGDDASSALISSYPAPMNGFIESYSTHEGKKMKNDSGKSIMSCFTNENLPILNTLANEFAVYDRWFCDVPSATEPNRLFSWMSTSKGMVSDVDARLAAGFIGDNIFELLDNYYYGSEKNRNSNAKMDKNNQKENASNSSVFDKCFGNNSNISDTWNVYFQNAPTPIFVEYTRHHPLKFRFLDDFFKNLEEKHELPLFSWIDPSYPNMKGFPSRDEHPPHDIRYGEKLLKRIYESLRESPLWSNTLLLVYYDEHGGYFDHVSPGLAPNPDGINSRNVNEPFDFNRLGGRVPVVMISPWIKKGYVAERPDIIGPYFNNSQYCHSSVIHTLRNEYMPNSKSITKRDEWSLTFENVINLNEMRTDCPMTLPDIPNNDGLFNNDNDDESGQCDENYKLPPTQFHKNLVSAAATICGVSLDDIDQYLVNQDAAGNFIKQCMEKFMKNGRSE